MDYTDFWVVAGTAAPVLALAHAVAIQPLLGRSNFSKPIKFAYFFAVVGFCSAGLALLNAFRVLGDISWPFTSGSRGVEVWELFLSLAMGLAVAVIAGLTDDEPPAAAGAPGGVDRPTS